MGCNCGNNNNNITVQQKKIVETVENNVPSKEDILRIYELRKQQIERQNTTISPNGDITYRTFRER